jgi:hypothetical protein
MMPTVKAKPFLLPNFLRLEVGEGELTMRVGALFPTDEDAAKFWDESKARWVAHVAKRRSQLSERAEHE